MQNNSIDAQGAQPQPQLERDHDKGFCALPKKLRSDLARLKRDGCIDGNAFIMAIYFADLTIGWQARFVSLSRSEMREGKCLPNGVVMADTLSGLTDNKSLGRAIEQLRAADIIEVEERGARYGTCYAIHRKYWLLLDRLPKWDLFGLVHYDAEHDPLGYKQDGCIEKPGNEVTGGRNPVVTTPPDSIMQSGRFHDATGQISLRNQPDFTMQPAAAMPEQSPAGPAAQGKIRLKDTSLNKQDKDTFAPSARAPLVARGEGDENALRGKEVRNDSDLQALAFRLFQAEKDQYPAKDWSTIKRTFVEQARAMLLQQEASAIPSSDSPVAVNASGRESEETAMLPLETEASVTARERRASPEAITQASRQPANGAQAQALLRVEDAQSALRRLKSSGMGKYAGKSRAWWEEELRVAEAAYEARRAEDDHPSGTQKAMQKGWPVHVSVPDGATASADEQREDVSLESEATATERREAEEQSSRQAGRPRARPKTRRERLRASFVGHIRRLEKEIDGFQADLDRQNAASLQEHGAIGWYGPGRYEMEQHERRKQSAVNYRRAVEALDQGMEEEEAIALAQGKVPA